ncbi:MAG: RluA family pseudouridine synthase [Treponema sp.]
MEKASTQYKREHKSDFGREKIEILYEDESIVVINKPAGMLSVPYPGSHARTAIAVLEQLMRKNGTYAAGHRPFVVHRLDRDTSGVMMFAVTEHIQRKIMNTWQTMVIERLYRAVAENPLNGLLPDYGIIDNPLAYNAYNVGFVPKTGDEPSENPCHGKKTDREMSIYERHLDHSGGKSKFRTVEARTHFKVLERGPTHTMFELSLDTGKKNQIRAHLASKGYPLAGDENYRAQTDPFGRLALHARTLEFIHPETGRHMKFEIPEPAEWLEYVKKGDLHPAVPVWQKEFDKKHTARKHTAHNETKQEQQDHVSGRKLAHMSFMDRGKIYGSKK